MDDAGDVVFGHDDTTVGGLREELPAEEPKMSNAPEVIPPVQGEQPPVPEVEAGRNQSKRFLR